MKPIRLGNGDCLELMKDIEKKTVDLIIVDLPYGTTQNKWDSLIDLDKLWKQFNRVKKDNAAVILFAQIPFLIQVANSNLKNLRYEIIWIKNRATGFLNTKKMPLKTHENILVFYEKLPKYNPQKTSGHRKVKSCSYWQSSNYGKQKPNSYCSSDRYPTDVLKFNSVQRSVHPTQKPVDLLSWLIRTYSNVGDTVLDCCMGSGTTGVSCKKLGRNFVGIEKDSKYFSIAKQRIKNTIGHKSRNKLFT